MCIFPVRVSNSIEELKYIFPCKQKDVQKAVEIAKEQDEIERLIIFGSSLTYSCGSGSDIDIAVDAQKVTSEDEFCKIVKPIKKSMCSESDIFHFNTINNELLKSETTRKGLIINDNRI